MKIAVMGAGAVGCYYGFKLARGGHHVVLIERPQHVEAIERQGLRLETQTFDEHVRVSASTEGSAVQGAQLVLFCVKSTDTESAAAAVKPHHAALVPCRSIAHPQAKHQLDRRTSGDGLRIEPDYTGRKQEEDVREGGSSALQGRE